MTLYSFKKRYVSPAKGITLILIILVTFLYYSLTTPKNHYVTIGIHPSATNEEIVNAYLNRTNTITKQSTTNELLKLRKAYIILSDYNKKKYYDQTGKSSFNSNQEIKEYLVYKILAESGAEYLILYAISRAFSFQNKFKVISSLTLLYLAFSWILEINFRDYHLKGLPLEFQIWNYALFEMVELPKKIFPFILTSLMVFADFFYVNDLGLPNYMLKVSLQTNRAILQRIQFLAHKSS